LSREPLRVVVVGAGKRVLELTSAARSAGLSVIDGPLAPAAVLRENAGAGGAGRALLATEGMPRETLAQLVLHYRARDVPVWLEVAEFPELRGALPVERIAGREGVVLAASKRLSLLRRGLDAGVSSVALLALSPALVVIGVLVKLSSPGPVLYRAVVVGQDGRPFTWYKFRTMRMADNDEPWRRQHFREFVQGNSGPAKIVDESRITAVGRWLRRHSIDELPQLLSVLRGDMTLVGPRPCLVYEYELLKPWHRGRFAVRPGLTGLWQVHGRGRVHADEMAFMDICYAFGRTWRSDLCLLWETLGVILSGRGAA
jgi:lipopolysaccharide/colanic/teichoic acid biosynthesis glycosyltransferase